MKKRVAVILVTSALLAGLIHTHSEWENALRILRQFVDILLISALEGEEWSVASAVIKPYGKAVDPNRAGEDQ